MDILKVSHLSVGYGQGTVVEDVHFSVGKGEILAMVGESGSGKTTIFKAIQKFLPADGRIESGQIWLKGEDITHMPMKDFRKFRGKIMGTVFQEPGSTLNPTRKIGRQFGEVLGYHLGCSKKEGMQIAIENMELMRLKNPETLLDRYPFQLSGGMKQRLSMAMAMSLKPDLILADEPTSSLDATVQRKIIDEFLRLRAEFHMSIVIITHDLALARYVSDHLLVLCHGKVAEYGPTKQVIAHPQSAYTQSLIQNMPKLDMEKRRPKDV